MRSMSLMVTVFIVFFTMKTTYAADCTQAGNIVSNCDFTTDLTDWSLFYGDSWSHQGADGATSPGSVDIDAEDLGGGDFWVRIDSICQSFPASTPWDWGFMAKLVSGGADTSCLIRTTFYSGAACTGPLGSTSSNVGVGSIAQIDSTWQEGFADNISSSPGTTQSAKLSIVCVNDTADFVARIDDTLFGQGLLPVDLMTFSIE